MCVCLRSLYMSHIITLSMSTRAFTLAMAETDRLLIYIIVIASMVKLCIVGRHPQVQDNEDIFLECPLNSYQVKFSSNCTDICPIYAPYKVFNLCMDFCPVSKILASDCSNSISPSTQTLPTKKIPTRCPKGICPQKRPYCFDYHCLSECPHGTVNDDLLCVYHCSNISALVYNNSCVIECPQDQQYNESGVCVSKCSTYNVLYGTNCVRTCPVDMFRYNKTCQVSCPQDAPFILEAFNTKFCLESCPDFTSVGGHVCQVQCPKGLDFLWNKSCVKKCPSSAPLIYVMKRRFPLHIPICISDCPDGMFSDGISCLQTCDRHMNVFNSTCVDSCPNSHRLLEGRSRPYTCVSECPIEQNRDGNRCTLTCPDTKFVFNRTCVQECPKLNTLVVNQNCLSQCPMNLYNESGVCVRKCTNYTYEQSCVRTCPETHKYVHDGKCINNCSEYNLFRYNNSCLRHCPTRYIFNHTCVDACPLSHPFVKGGWYHYCVSSCNVIVNTDGGCKCPASFLSFNSTCVQKCPHQASIRHEGKCIAQCPDTSVSYNNTCHQSCPAKAKYEHDRMCTEECPLSHPYYATVRRKVTTNYSYRTTFVLVTYCLDTCNDKKSPGKYVFNNTCVNRCPNTTVLYESKCVDECPSDKPLTYKKEDEGKYLIVCVEDCPGPTFTKGRYCYDQCPEPLASYSPNRTCLEQCPTHRKFRYRFRTNGNNFAFKCKTTCGNKFINSNTCVDTCPSDEPLLLGQTCVSECPASHMFVSYQMQQCLETCKPPLVELNHTCYRHCPVSSPFVLDNKCVKECPTTFNLTAPSPQGTVCARECKSPLIRENNKCIRTCPDKKFIINNVCEYVLGCPKPYSYIEHSSQGTTCRKNCENNEFFLEDFRCTKKCPKFAVGRKCVDKCPKTHPYTFKKYSGEDITLCQSVCPKWIFKKNCVSYCPTGYVKLNSNKTCVKDCPPSAPIRMYSGCQNTCYFWQVISEENTCIATYNCHSSKGFCIYNSRCVRPCPHGTYPNNDNNSVLKTQGYTIAIISLAVSGICFFIAAYLMFRRTTCLPCAASENKGNNLEQVDTNSGHVSSKKESIDDGSTVATMDESQGYRHNTSAKRTTVNSSSYDALTTAPIDEPSGYNNDTTMVDNLDNTPTSSFLSRRDGEYLELSSCVGKDIQTATVTVDINYEHPINDTGEIQNAPSISEETFLKDKYE